MLEVDHHFIADARQVHLAEIRAGDGLGDMDLGSAAYVAGGVAYSFGIT